MGVLDIFSKRSKKKENDGDVFQYDSIPKELRVQVIHILNDALGNRSNYQDSYLEVHLIYQHIVEALCREYGVFNLSEDNPNLRRDYYSELHNFILREQNVERLLDAIELSFKFIDRLTRRFEYLNRQSYDERADDALEELNHRFLEHSVGYQFENNFIIRIDSKVLHNETIKPALSLLNDKVFSGAEAEFHNAHEHYRHGRYKEAISESLKSFESVLKVICEKNKWKYSSTDGAARLLAICFDKELIPAYLQSEFSSVRSILESGVPAIRNKVSGHGQGGEVVEVPRHLVSYTLHTTAASIVFLIEAYNAM